MTLGEIGHHLEQVLHRDLELSSPCEQASTVLASRSAVTRLAHLQILPYHAVSTYLQGKGRKNKTHSQYQLWSLK